MTSLSRCLPAARGLLCLWWSSPPPRLCLPSLPLSARGSSPSRSPRRWELRSCLAAAGLESLGGGGERLSCLCLGLSPPACFACLAGCSCSLRACVGVLCPCRARAGLPALAGGGGDLLSCLCLRLSSSACLALFEGCFSVSGESRLRPFLSSSAASLSAGATSGSAASSDELLSVLLTSGRLAGLGSFSFLACFASFLAFFIAFFAFLFSCMNAKGLMHASRIEAPTHGWAT